MQKAAFVFLCTIAASGLGTRTVEAQTALGCDVSAQAIEGGPGTVVAVSCPSGCGSAAIWGTGIYSDDSSVCSAAIHAGAIPAAGGFFQVIIREGQPAYPASTQNGITSHEWGTWERSFEVAQMAAPQALVCESTAQGLAGDPGAEHVVTCPAGCGASPIWGTQVYSDDSSVCTAGIHAGVIGPEGGSLRIVIRPGQDHYAASAQFGVTSADWGNYPRSFEVVGARTPAPDAGGPVALGCGDNAQSLPGDPGAGMTVTCPAGCSPAAIWGTGIYSDDSVVCTAAAHAGIITLAEGGTFALSIAPGQAEYPASDAHGISSASWGQWSRSYTVSALPGAGSLELTCGSNAQDISGELDQAIQVTCPADCGAAPVWGTGIYSDDSSVCAAAIHAGVIGPQGGQLLLVIAAGQPSYVGSTQNGVTSAEWGEWQRSFTFAGVTGPGETPPDPEPTPQPTGALACSDNAIALAGDPGTALAVSCPAGCELGSIYGTGVYSDDSVVCTAAIHAGVIDREQGGAFSLVILSGQPTYEASEQNGVSSNAWESWHRSFSPYVGLGAFWQAVAGSWTGTGTQFNTGETWSIALEVDPTAAVGALAGSVHYPSSRCGASLTRLPDVDGRLAFAESYQYGGSGCQRGGSIRLTPVSYGTNPELAYDYFLPDGTHGATSTLTRPEHDVCGTTAQALLGTWQGTGAQTGSSATWTIQMQVFAIPAVGEAVGTISYPSLACGGTLTRLADADGRFVFRETITQNTATCGAGGNIRVHVSEEPLAGVCRLQWDYYLDDGSHGGHADLSR